MNSGGYGGYDGQDMKSGGGGGGALGGGGGSTGGGAPDLLLAAFNQALKPYNDKVDTLEAEIADLRAYIDQLEAQRNDVHAWIDKRGLRPGKHPLLH